MKQKAAPFWHNAHTTHRLLYHVVFVPKYRRKILQRELVRRLTELFYDCCRANRWYIHELAILPDHIHILLQLPPRIPICDALQSLKGGTSRVIRKEFPELQEFLWGDSLWADGYFAETAGRASEQAIRKYIKAQWAQEPSSSPGL